MAESVVLLSLLNLMELFSLLSVLSESKSREILSVKVLCMSLCNFAFLHKILDSLSFQFFKNITLKA